MTFFSGSTLGESVSNYVRTGALHDIAFFQKRLRAILGDITFQDAYDRSGGRILCVAVCATREGERPRLLNYLTAPHVIVWSAVAASCAFPNLFPPQPLLAKSRVGTLVPWQPEGRTGPRRWRDGSLEEDLPMRCGRLRDGRLPSLTSPFRWAPQRTVGAVQLQLLYL
jgi:TAG lipase/steryl ester hydrolase/phospholipase A2/LPA acyltransferase